MLPWSGQLPAAGSAVLGQHAILQGNKVLTAINMYMKCSVFLPEMCFLNILIIICSSFKRIFFIKYLFFS